MDDEAVLSKGAVEVVQSESSYVSLFEGAVETDRIAVFVHDGPLSYFVGIYDEAVQIGVEDDDGMPRAVVEATDDDVREWADAAYEEYKGRSERLV